MSIATCPYCSHRNVVAAARCAHCGAPLSEADQPPTGATLSTASAQPAAASGGPKWLSEPAAGLSALSHELSDAEQRHPKWLWAVAGLAVAGIVVLAMIVYAVADGFHLPPAPAITGGGTGAAVENLPEQLRQAASCSPYDTRDKTDKCVVRADDPLLGGNISGGEDLTFYINVLPRDQLTDTVDKWRAAGGAIIEDDTVFAAIGPSADVLYANTATGLRVNTATFASRGSAQKFLSRSGLHG